MTTQPSKRSQRRPDPRAVIDEGMAAEIEAALRSKDLTKEGAVRHKRHWVRLTRLCNQRCIFCLDSWNHNGTYVDTAQLLQYIELGARLGSERLILSGGEPTIHPDYVKFIRHGRKVGYDWIQTVTNGMMFAYPEFTRKCIQAGLDEVTVSIHGHNAKIQDRLTGTRGAFEKGIQGIRNIKALSGGRTVINIDIVINKQNIRHLREIIDYFRAMDIHEFDLLYMVPFGRGFAQHRKQLYFNLDDHHEDLQRALEPSREPGVYIWTNRLPPEHLEGFEDLIQAPHKMESEVQGGLHNFEGYMKMGVAPDCHGERCDYCFLKGLCHDNMFWYRERLVEGRFERVRIDLAEELEGPGAEEAMARQKPQWLTVQGDDVESVAAYLDASPPADEAQLVVELRDESAPAELVTQGATIGTTAVDRVIVRGVSALESTIRAANTHIEAGASTPEIEVALDAATAQWLLEHADSVEALKAADKLIAHLPNFEYMSQTRENGVEPEHLEQLGALGFRMMNVAPCLGGAKAEHGAHFELSRAMLDAKGNMKVSPYVQRYVLGEYYKKSVRCQSCALVESCKGMHIQFLRAHGFGTLKPIIAEDEPALASA